MTDTVTVRTATPDDAPALVAVLADAFMADRVSAWIFPDEQERQEMHPRFFQPFVDGVLASGLVLTTTDLAGVALWLDVDPARPADPDGSGQLHAYMRGTVGDGPAGRFQVLDELMTARHPHHEAHAYLPFIAVACEHQGRGSGRRCCATASGSSMPPVPRHIWRPARPATRRCTSSSASRPWRRRSTCRVAPRSTPCGASRPETRAPGRLA